MFNFSGAVNVANRALFCRPEIPPAARLEVSCAWSDPASNATTFQIVRHLKDTGFQRGHRACLLDHDIMLLSLSVVQTVLEQTFLKCATDGQEECLQGEAVSITAQTSVVFTGLPGKFLVLNRCFRIFSISSQSVGPARKVSFHGQENSISTTGRIL
jgi:hypothetical protein